MKIIVENRNEKLLIQGFCDVALRAGGIKNVSEVQVILSSIVEKKAENKNENNRDAKTAGSKRSPKIKTKKR